MKKLLIGIGLMALGMLVGSSPAFGTVITTNISVTFVCTGSVGPFPFNYSISGANALTVAQNGVVLATSAYTVVPVNNNYDNGGSVTLVSVCPASQPLVITRTTPLTQTSVFTDNMPNPMKAIENGLDKLTEITQELNAKPTGTAANPSAPNCSYQYNNNLTAFGGVPAEFLADCFSGTDIGAKINAAYLSATGSSGTPATGVVVNLAPNGAYSYTTDIRIPNNVSSPYITVPILDCQGSTLTYTGSGEGFTIMGQNSHFSGELRNCNIIFTNPAATAHLWSRIGFKVTNNHFSLGTGGIAITNDLAHGGPGYTEEQVWSGNLFDIPANGVPYQYVEDPSILGNTSIGSFFYNFHKSEWWGPNGGSKGIHLVAAAGAPQPGDFGSFYDIHVNLGGNNNSVVSLDQSTSMTRGTMNLSGENDGGSTQYDVFASGTASTFQMFGQSYITGGVTHGYGSGVPESNIIFLAGKQPFSDDLCAASFSTVTNAGEAGGINNERNSKNIQCGGATLSLLANAGGTENDGYNMVGRRATDSTNSDVDIAGTGTAIQSITYADALGYLGFGSGFSFAAHIVSGTDISKPLSATSPEFRSSMTVRDPQATNTTLADGGGYIQRYVDHSTGNIHDYVLSQAAGQHPHHYMLDINDQLVPAAVNVIDCSVPTSGVGTCSFPNIAVTGTCTGCGGGGSSAWSALTNPTGNLSLGMGANSTVFGYGAATGSSDMMLWSDTTNNTGTGIMGHFHTASGSTETPWQADANGVGWKVGADGSLQGVGTLPTAISQPVGTGTLPALPANSAGLVSPVTGGTSYLLQYPATITAGIAHVATPGTVYGVNVAQLTSSAVNLASADVTGLLPHANIAATAVTPGSYTSANITIAADGSITAATNGSGGGGGVTFSGSGCSVTGSDCTVGSATATITLSAISSGNGTLTLSINGTTSGNGNIDTRFNSDTGAHYTWQYFQTSGATNGTADTSCKSIILIGDSTPGWGSATYTIAGYDLATQKGMTGKSFESQTPIIREGGCVWTQTGAITSITFTVDDASNFATGTTFTLK